MKRFCVEMLLLYSNETSVKYRSSGKCIVKCLFRIQYELDISAHFPLQVYCGIVQQKIGNRLLKCYGYDEAHSGNGWRSFKK